MTYSTYRPKRHGPFRLKCYMLNVLYKYVGRSEVECGSQLYRCVDLMVVLGVDSITV